MEAVILMGLQGAGKSSFYRERFFDSHVRINLDQLKTRYRERRLLETCLQTGQKIVVDNTNPTRSERAIYIEAAKAARFSVVGYYFQSRVVDCLQRNSTRTGTQKVSDIAIFATAKKFELPRFSEGFDQLFYVHLEGEKFVIEDWKEDEVR